MVIGTTNDSKIITDINQTCQDNTPISFSIYGDSVGRIFVRWTPQFSDNFTGWCDG
jgi:hypothetical protein